MKLSLAIASLATILSHECAAFTAPRAHQLIVPSNHNSRQSSGGASCFSTLVEDADTITSTNNKKQEVTEEQMQASYISQTVEESQKSYLDDGFVFGLDGSGLERPKGKDASVVVEGDSLETTPKQVAIVTGTFAGQALIAANAIHHLYTEL